MNLTRFGSSLPGVRPPALHAAVRFTLASAASFLAACGLTIGLHEWCGISESKSFGVALGFTFFQNFLAYRYFIYGRSPGPLLPQFAIYAGSSAVFRGVEYFVFDWFVTHLAIDYRMLTTLVLIGSTTGKFVFYRFVFATRAVRASVDDSGDEPLETPELPASDSVNPGVASLSIVGRRR